MNRKITLRIIVLLAVILPYATTQAQISENFDTYSCNRDNLFAQCWRYASLALSTTDAITAGNCGVRTNPLSNPALNQTFLLMPVLTTDAGATVTVAFKHKVINRTSNPVLNVYAVNPDDSETLIFTFTYANTSVQNASFTFIPAERYFKLRFSPTGSGGMSRMIMDDLSISSNGASNVSFVGYDLNTAGTNFDCNSPLPVTFQNFNVVKENLIHILDWQTTQETNNDYFNVQRSGDAVNFVEIGIVRSKSVPENGVYFYQFIDEQPLNEINYYRLKQVDIDGTTAFSKIIAITAEKPDTELVLFPNPSENYVLIRNMPENAKIRVSSVAGVQVYEQSCQQCGVQKIDISHFIPGTYFVKVTDELGKASSLKFVKH